MVVLVWLNGGPGCSSLGGLAEENGPLHFTNDNATPSANQYSWTKLANVLYIDQPVGSGYSDGSVEAMFNDQVTQGFISWLGAFYEIFSGLKSKSTYIMGESYAGIYVCQSTQRCGCQLKNYRFHTLPKRFFITTAVCRSTFEA